MDALSLKDLNYRLYITVIFTLLVPTLYNTFRIYLIGDIPGVWGFNIASQIAWLNIIYEILQEGITLPLFFILGPLASQPLIFQRKLTSGLVVIIPLYSIIAFLIWIFTDHLVHFLSQSPDLIIDTINYIRLESVAIPLRVITDIILIALITLSVNRWIYIYLIAQLLIRIVSDYVFINDAMLGLGVIGIAYSSIIIHLFLSISGLIILYRVLLNMEQPKSVISSGIAWKKWLNVSLLSGAESGVRNAAFIVMILKLVNEIGEQGTLWIANGFIWGWLLLPILALGSLIKQDVGRHNGMIGNRFKGYFSLSAIICMFWIFTIPFYGWFIQNIMGVDNYESIVSLTILFLPFYIAFAINNVLDSYLYGMGRTDLMLYQSLLVNCVYYIIAFVLYIQGIFVPTLQSIALLFGFGIIFDLIATIILFRLCQYPLIRPSRDR